MKDIMIFETFSRESSMSALVATSSADPAVGAMLVTCERSALLRSNFVKVVEALGPLMTNERRLISLLSTGA
jgi:hypothetical protein